MKSKTTVSDYYDTKPTSLHVAGDVWSNLPVYGLWGFDALPGIVITPACDLSQGKIESITYLPIVPVNIFLGSVVFIGEYIDIVEGQMKFLNIHPGGELLEKRYSYSHINVDEAQYILNYLCECSSEIKKSTQNITSFKKACLAAMILLKIAKNGCYPVKLPSMRFLYGKKWDGKIEGIIKNNSGISHFLPPDEQDPDWSCLLNPSVALFRYPFSIPIQVLDVANVIATDSWPSDVNKFDAFWNVEKLKTMEKPMKILNLKPRFMADLKTRYLAMHIRIGSPDFSNDSIQKYANNLHGGMCD